MAQLGLWVFEHSPHQEQAHDTPSSAGQHAGLQYTSARRNVAAQAGLAAAQQEGNARAPY